MADVSTQPAPDEAQPTNGRDDVADLLSEFERSSGRPPSTAPDDKPRPADGQRPASGTEQPSDKPQAADSAPATGDIAALHRWALGIEAERLEARNQADARGAIAKAQEAVSDIPGLPADYAENYVTSRYLMDPEFAAAWDGRYENPEAQRRAERAVERAVRELVKSAKSIPDRDATEDREAVSAAVRGVSTKAPVGAPPSFGNMDNREFSNRVKRDYGFDPGV